MRINYLELSKIKKKLNFATHSPFFIFSRKRINIYVQNHTVALRQVIYKFRVKFLKMKPKKLDSKGNIIVGTTAILIVALLLICIFTVTTITYIKNTNLDSQANDNFKYIIEDYSANLEVLGRDAIAEATQKIYNGLRISDSPDQIKKNLNKV